MIWRVIMVWLAAASLAVADFPRQCRTQIPSGSWSQTYSYDSVWRTTSITSSAGSFGYHYPPSAGRYLAGGVTLPNGAFITNTYDSVARLTGTALANQFGHVLDGYVYGLDSLGLGTNITRNLGLTTNTVTIGYDGINQLTSWSAKESNGTLRHNEQLGYDYDAAENLQTRTNDALIQTFNVDALNQMSSVTRTGPLTVIGATPVPATVTVNGATAQTNGDFTFAGTNNNLANGTNIFTNIAQNIYGLRATNLLSLNLPSTVTLQYDSNGNLTNDGTCIFSYDAENQLTNIFATNAWRIGFVYDGLKRRRIRREYTWQSTNWIETNEVRYICDGQLVLQERDTNNNPQVTYTRGLDFSLSLQRAGGIGGLLARTDINGSTFYHADGSGNITALTDEYQDIVARYRYDPFGKLLGRWGALADANHYRFSSMEFFSSPNIYGYPRRFYEPNFQRWLNRDPIQERGGVNLYRFSANSPTYWVDTDGEGLWGTAIGAWAGGAIGGLVGGTGGSLAFPGGGTLAGGYADGAEGALLGGAIGDAIGDFLGGNGPIVCETTGKGRGNPGERRQQGSSPNPTKTTGKGDNQTGQKPNVPNPTPTPPTPPPPDPPNPYDAGPWWRDFPDTPPKDFLPPSVS